MQNTESYNVIYKLKEIIFTPMFTHIFGLKTKVKVGNDNNIDNNKKDYHSVTTVENFCPALQLLPSFLVYLLALRI